MPQHQRAYTGRALVLRTVNYGDKDKIVTFLMEGEGKKSAIAKGGRVSQKRFGGAFELFRVSEVSISESHKQNALGVLTEASVQEDFRRIEESFEKITVGSFATELAREMVQDGEGGDDVFGVLTEFYDQLERRQGSSASLDADLQTFVLRLLAVAGFHPILEDCYRCGKGVQGGHEVVFSKQGEGALCAGCRQPGQATVATHAAVLLTLARLGRAYHEASAQDRVEEWGSVLIRSRRLLLDVVHAILGKALKSEAMLESALRWS